QTFTVKEQRTDDRGAFAVEVFGTATETTVSLRARRGDAVTDKPVDLRGEALGRPVTLAISPWHARSLAVRVLDEDGRPVAGAAVAAWFQPISPDPTVNPTYPLEVRDTAGWATDPE